MHTSIHPLSHPFSTLRLLWWGSAGAYPSTDRVTAANKHWAGFPVCINTRRKWKRNQFSHCKVSVQTLIGNSFTLLHPAKPITTSPSTPALMDEIQSHRHVSLVSSISFSSSLLLRTAPMLSALSAPSYGGRKSYVTQVMSHTFKSSHFPFTFVTSIVHIKHFWCKYYN